VIAAPARFAGLGFLLLLLGGGIWLANGGGSAPGPTGPAEPASPTAEPGVEKPIEPVSAPLPPGVPPVPQAKTPNRVAYPGGDKLPALNGVEVDVQLNWGQGPYTRVVGVINGPGGWQWYVHENGAHSTVAMVTMNGVPQAMGFVAEPTQPLPTHESVQAAVPGAGR
jgi:hypothetical protein